MRSTIDGLSSHICVIDDQGRILVTNRAWKNFARDNDAIMERVSEGVCYFEALKPVVGGDMADAEAFADGIRRFLGEVSKNSSRNTPATRISRNGGSLAGRIGFLSAIANMR